MEKLNINDNHLIRRFDFNTKQFYYTQKKDGIDVAVAENNLDRASRKQLLKENKALLKNPGLINVAMIEEQRQIENLRLRARVEKMKACGLSSFGFEYLGPDQGTINPELEQYLNSILDDEKGVVGIHRVGAYFTQEMLDDIFANGLKITGHGMGAYATAKDLSNNVGYYASNETIKKELKYADQYKMSVGSVLISLPFDVLEQNDDIYISDEGGMRINPKYVVGYVPVYPNHHIENIMLSPSELARTEGQKNSL